jgi:hypothetical protein
MFLVFFANKEMVYTNYETRDKTVNMDYIVDALEEVWEGSSPDMA